MMQQQGFVVFDLLEVKNLEIAIISNVQNSRIRKWLCK